MEHTPEFRKSLADPQTGGLDTFRVIRALNIGDAEGHVRAVTVMAGEMAVIIRKHAQAERETDPEYVLSPKDESDLYSCVMRHVTKSLGMDRCWLEMEELAALLPAYHSLSDERRWHFAAIKGWCSDNLDCRLEDVRRNYGEAGELDLLRLLTASLLYEAFDTLAKTVFGHNTWKVWGEYVSRMAVHGRILKDEVVDVINKTERRL